jgi:hypothetical protein
MVQSAVYLTQELPDFGSSITVTENTTEIERLIRVAKLNGDETINLTRSGKRDVVIPLRLFGLASGR